MNSKFKAISERWYPFLGGIATCGLYLLFFKNFAFVSRDALPNLFTAVVGVSAIAVGFLATAQSILISLETRRAVKFLKEANGFSRLVNYMMAATHLSFVLAALSAFALLLDPKAPRWWYHYAFSAWLLMLAWAGLAYYRIVSIFETILRSPD